MATSSSNFIMTYLILSLVLALTIVIVPQAEARAFFVFGDSLVDSGNNNYLATTARADAPPYGIDYPTRRPTGRFSNGFNIPDIISQFSDLSIILHIIILTHPLTSNVYNFRPATRPIGSSIAMLKPRA